MGEIEKEEDWDIAMPEDGKEDPQDPVGKKKAPSKSPIDIFGEDEDWNIALPTIPEEGKAKKKAPGKSTIDAFGEEEDWDISLPTIPEGKEDDECAKTRIDACDLLFAKPKDEGVKEKRSLRQAAAKTQKDEGVEVNISIGKTGGLKTKKEKTKKKENKEYTQEQWDAWEKENREKEVVKQEAQSKKGATISSGLTVV